MANSQLAIKGAATLSVDEISRSAESVLKNFEITGERMILKNGVKIPAVEYAVAVAFQDISGDTAKLRAAYALHDAKRLGDDYSKEVRTRLEGMLSSGSLRNLMDVANNVLPRLEANKNLTLSPSVLKDVRKAFKFDDAGKLLPLKDQPLAGRKLLDTAKKAPLTLNKARAIRAEYGKEQGGTKEETPQAPTAGERSGTKDFATAIGSLQTAKATFAKNMADATAEQIQAAIVLISDVARLFKIDAKPAAVEVKPTVPAAK
jgi:hypothetical protein